MKLALYVHDLKLEIGHSNSLIELIRHLPEEFSDKIEEIEVVTFTTTPLEVLFPKFKGKLKWVKVPFSGIKPVLLKSIYYQIWTFVYNKLLQSTGKFRIGIGISCLDVDAVSIQFIHHQWTKRGLEMEASHGIRKFYKKFLFAYFEWCENFLFPKRNLKIFSPAKFLTNFLKTKAPEVDAVTIYSGVNLSRFELKAQTRQEIFQDLIGNYPVLQGLKLDEPIYLFVGAYERKGLFQALDLLADRGNAQFIVIGSPSMGRSVQWPSSLKVFPITFTKEVSKFYALSDVFLFPTMYEPFGLVLFEAMAMGLGIITRRSEVGASELLEGLPEVYFCDSPNFSMPNIQVKNFESRKNLRDLRLEMLGDVSWSNAGKELADFIGH